MQTKQNTKNNNIKNVKDKNIKEEKQIKKDDQQLTMETIIPTTINEISGLDYFTD